MVQKKVYKHLTTHNQLKLLNNYAKIKIKVESVAPGKRSRIYNKTINLQACQRTGGKIPSFDSFFTMAALKELLF